MINNELSTEMTLEDTAKLSELIAHWSRTIDESNQRSEGTFAEIAILKAETEAMLSQLKGMFNVEAVL